MNSIRGGAAAITPVSRLRLICRFGTRAAIYGKINGMTADSEILAELREQTKWLRLLGFQSLRPLISEVLASERDRLVYELSDGARTARELGKLAGVSHPTVLRLWQ